MKNNEFKFLKCYCNNKKKILILIIEEHDNGEYLFLDSCVKYNGKLYKIISEGDIRDNMKLLICNEELDLKVNDFFYTIKYDVSPIAKYFIDDIDKLIEKD